jgi:MFS family permease
MNAEARVYSRGGATLLAFGGLGVYAYALYALGPVLTLLRRDMDLSYALMSVHATAFAAGVLVPGLFFARLADWLGRRPLLWLSATVLGSGSIVMMLGASLPVTLSAAGFMGLGGATLQITTIALISDLHTGHRDQAFVEANAVGSAAALVAPVLIATLAALGLGWRWSLLVPALALVSLYVAFGRQPLPSRSQGPNTESRQWRLGRSFWFLGALCGAAVGAELCAVFYGPSILQQNGVTAGEAAGLMIIFASGELIGRLVGSRLVRRPARARYLFYVALGVSIVGFAFLSTAGNLSTAVVGLFIVGLGVANLFPLALSLAVSAAPGRTDDATALAQLVVGASLILAPLSLGALADRVGVVRAYAMQLALLVLSALLLWFSRRGWAVRGTEAKSQTEGPISQSP